jgi:hypothetical protein
VVGTAIFVMLNIVYVKVTKNKAIGILRYPNWETTVSLPKVKKVSVYAASSPIFNLKLLLLCIRVYRDPQRGSSRTPERHFVSVQLTPRPPLHEGEKQPAVHAERKTAASLRYMPQAA